MCKVVLGREVYDKIMYYVNKSNFEISGLGVVEVIKGIPTVTDIYLLDQENSSAETEIDADAISTLMYEHHKSGKPGELKFWWHSHVNMGVFWSGTDIDTINDLTQNGWFIHGVFNKKDEYKIAYTTLKPFPMMVDDLDMEIDEEMISENMESLYIKEQEIAGLIEAELSDECDVLYDKHVTIKTYTQYNSNYGGFPYSGTSHNHHRKKDDADGNIVDVSTKTDKAIVEIGDNGLEFNDDYNYDGYFELFDLGLSGEEIVELNKVDVFDKEDYDLYIEDMKTFFGGMA